MINQLSKFQKSISHSDKIQYQFPPIFISHRRNHYYYPHQLNIGHKRRKKMSERKTVAASTYLDFFLFFLFFFFFKFPTPIPIPCSCCFSFGSLLFYFLVLLLLLFMVVGVVPQISPHISINQDPLRERERANKAIHSSTLLFL